MSENSTDFPRIFPKITKKDEVFSAGEGVSWSKFPRKILEIPHLPGSKISYLAVAVYLADHSSNSRNYPTFTVKQTELAKKLNLSRRVVVEALSFLALNRVVSVRSRDGESNLYTWNEDFLRGCSDSWHGDATKSSMGMPQNVASGCYESAPLYIDLSLDIFYIYHKEFFAPHQPPYKIPAPKRKQKGLAASGSSFRLIDRKDAWREAALSAYEKIKGNHEDALARIYLALMSGSIEEVRYPKQTLLWRVTDEESIHTARSHSSFKHCLYNDEDFKAYLEQRRKKHG